MKKMKQVSCTLFSLLLLTSSFPALAFAIL